MISFLKFQVLHVMTSFHVTVLEISFPLQNNYFFVLPGHFIYQSFKLFSNQWLLSEQCVVTATPSLFADFSGSLCTFFSYINIKCFLTQPRLAECLQSRICV